MQYIREELSKECRSLTSLFIDEMKKHNELKRFLLDNHR